MDKAIATTLVEKTSDGMLVFITTADEADALAFFATIGDVFHAPGDSTYIVDPFNA